MTCVGADQERNFYNVPQTIVNVAHFDMFRETYGGYSYQHQEPTSVKHDDFYRVCIIPGSSALVKTTVLTMKVLFYYK